MIHTPRSTPTRDRLRNWMGTLLVLATIVAMWNWREVHRAYLRWATGKDYLALAATSGRADDVRAALADGQNPNQPGRDGFTPLMWASASGDTRSIELLIRAGADIRAMSPTGITPMIIAAQRGNLDAVQLLLDAGVDPAQQQRQGPTALYAAASFGHERVVALLLRHGADVNARCGRGRTALMVAASQTASTRDGIARLLNAGARPGTRDDDGNSAEDEAASAGREDLLEMFDAWQDAGRRGM
jgi:ankyrin repeat protein